jgi:hypothetical protein
MSQYRAFCGVVSQAEAEDLGKWLAKYEVELTGLQVWQVGQSGKRYRDDATAETIRSTVSSAASSVVTSGAGGSALVPLVALLSPAAILAMIASIPVLLAATHKTTKKLAAPSAAVMAHDPIVATELTFDLAAVSARRRGWSEYLLSIYGALHGWTKLDGMAHREQWAQGAAYAARTGGYPAPWSERKPGDQPVSRQRSVTSRHPKSRGRGAA